jgi:hypothetical protein
VFVSNTLSLKVAKNLSPDQVHELHDDIEHYLSLEKNEANIEFWTVSDDNFPMLSLLMFPLAYDGDLQGPLGPDYV